MEGWPSIHVLDHSTAMPWNRAMWHITRQRKQMSKVTYEGSLVMLPDLKLPHDDVLGPVLRWTFKRHRVVVMLDVKASLCTIGPNGLLLDSMLAITQRALTALSLSRKGADFSEDGMLLSVVAQGSRVTDMRVLTHEVVLKEATLPAVLAEVSQAWDLLCMDLSSGSWCDSGRVDGGASRSVRRANLQDLILNAKAVLDRLPVDACPSILVVTDGVVGMPDKQAVRDICALLRCWDISLGFVLCVERKNSKKAALTYAHVPDDASLQALAHATARGFCFFANETTANLETLLYKFLARSSTMIENPEHTQSIQSLHCFSLGPRFQPTQGIAPSYPDVELGNVPAATAKQASNTGGGGASGVSGKKDGEIRYAVKGVKAANKQFLRALGARMLEGFRLDRGVCDSDGSPILAELSMSFLDSFRITCRLSVLQDHSSLFVEVRFGVQGESRTQRHASNSPLRTPADLSRRRRISSTNNIPSMVLTSPHGPPSSRSPQILHVSSSSLINSGNVSPHESGGRSPASMPMRPGTPGGPMVGMSPLQTVQVAPTLSPRTRFFPTGAEDGRRRKQHVLEDQVLNEEHQEAMLWIKALVGMDRAHHVLSSSHRSIRSMDGALLRTCISTYFESQSIDILLSQPLRVALSRDSRASMQGMNVCVSALATWAKGSLSSILLPPQPVANAGANIPPSSFLQAAFFAPLKATPAGEAPSPQSSEGESLCVVEVTVRQLLCCIKVCTFNATSAQTNAAVATLEACLKDTFFSSGMHEGRALKSADDIVPSVPAYMMLRDRSVWQQLLADWEEETPITDDGETDLEIFSSVKASRHGHRGTSVPTATHGSSQTMEFDVAQHDVAAPMSNSREEEHALSLPSPLMSFLPIRSWRLRLNVHSSAQAVLQLVLRMRCRQGFTVGYGQLTHSASAVKYLDGSDISFDQLERESAELDEAIGPHDSFSAFPDDPLNPGEAEAACVGLVTLIRISDSEAKERDELLQYLPNAPGTKPAAKERNVLLQYRLRLDRKGCHTYLTSHMYMEPINGEVEIYNEPKPLLPLTSPSTSSPQFRAYSPNRSAPNSSASSPFHGSQSPTTGGLGGLAALGSSRVGRKMSTKSLFVEIAKLLQEQDREVADEVSSLDAIYQRCRRSGSKGAKNLVIEESVSECPIRIGAALRGHTPFVQHLESFAECYRFRIKNDDDSDVDSSFRDNDSITSEPSLMPSLSGELHSPPRPPSSQKQDSSSPIEISQNPRSLRRVNTWSGRTIPHPHPHTHVQSASPSSTAMTSNIHSFLHQPSKSLDSKGVPGFGETLKTRKDPSFKPPFSTALSAVIPDPSLSSSFSSLNSFDFLANGNKELPSGFGVPSGDLFFRGSQRMYDRMVDLLSRMTDCENQVSDDDVEAGIEPFSRCFLKAIKACGVIVIIIPPFSPYQVYKHLPGQELVPLPEPGGLLKDIEGEEGEVVAGIEVRLYSLVRLDVRHVDQHTSVIANLLGRKVRATSMAGGPGGRGFDPGEAEVDGQEELDWLNSAEENATLMRRREAVVAALETLKVEMMELHNRAYCHSVAQALLSSFEVSRHVLDTCASWSQSVCFDLVPPMNDWGHRQWQHEFKNKLMAALLVCLLPVPAHMGYFIYQYGYSRMTFTNRCQSTSSVNTTSARDNSISLDTPPLLVRLLFQPLQGGLPQASSLQGAEKSPVLQFFFTSQTVEEEPSNIDGTNTEVGVDEEEGGPLFDDWPFEKAGRPSNLLQLPSVYRQDIWKGVHGIRARIASFLLGSKMELFTKPEHNIKLILSLLYETQWADPANRLCSFKVAFEFAVELDSHVAMTQLAHLFAARPSLEMRPVSDEILMSTAVNHYYQNAPSGDPCSGTGVLPYWLLIHLRPGFVDVLLQRPLCVGPDQEWVSKEVMDCVCDCNKILLLKRMFETRVLNRLLLTRDIHNLLVCEANDSGKLRSPRHSRSSPPRQKFASRISSSYEETVEEHEKKAAGEANASVAGGQGEDFPGPNQSVAGGAGEGLEGRYECPVMHKMTLHVHERLTVQEGIALLKTKPLQPFALIDCQSIFVFKENHGSIFYLIPYAVEKESVIEVRVHGMCPPSAELTQGFAGVLQSALDEMLLKHLAVQLMRNTHMRVSVQDCLFIAPPGALAPTRGQLTLRAKGRDTKKLSVYLYRSMTRVLSVLRLEDPKTQTHALSSQMYAMESSYPDLVGKNFTVSDNAGDHHSESSKERGGTLLFNEARFESEPWVSFIYGWQDEDQAAFQRPSHMTGLRKTPSISSKPPARGGADMTSHMNLPSSSVPRPGSGLAILRFTNPRVCAASDRKGSRDGAGDDEAVLGGGLREGHGVSFRPCGRWEMETRGREGQGDKGEAESEVGGEGEVRLDFYVEIWSRGPLKHEGLLMRIMSAGEQAVAEFEAERYLHRPYKPIASIYARLLGPTMALWNDLSKQPSSRVQVSFFPLQPRVPAFAVQSCMIFVNRKLMGVLPENEVVMLDASDFETEDAVEKKVTSWRTSAERYEQGAQGWISRGSLMGSPMQHVVYSAPFNERGCINPEDGLPLSSPKVLIARGQSEGIALYYYSIDPDVIKSLGEFLAWRVEWMQRRCALLTTALHHKAGLFIPALHNRTDVDDFGHVPIKDLITRSGPTRRQELARTRAIESQSQLDAGVEEEDDVPHEKPLEDSKQEEELGLSCAAHGGCGVHMRKGWTPMMRDFKGLDPLKRHVVLNKTVGDRVWDRCVQAQFVHGVRGELPELVAKISTGVGVRGRMTRLLERLQERLERAGCLPCEDRLDPLSKEGSPAHEPSIPSHEGSKWLSAEGVMGGHKVVVLIELYLLRGGSSEGLACCDIYVTQGASFCESPTCIFSRPLSMVKLSSVPSGLDSSAPSGSYGKLSEQCGSGRNTPQHHVGCGRNSPQGRITPGVPRHPSPTCHDQHQAGYPHDTSRTSAVFAVQPPPLWGLGPDVAQGEADALGGVDLQVMCATLQFSVIAHDFILEEICALFEDERLQHFLDKKFSSTSTPPLRGYGSSEKLPRNSSAEQMQDLLRLQGDGMVDISGHGAVDSSSWGKGLRSLAGLSSAREEKKTALRQEQSKQDGWSFEEAMKIPLDKSTGSPRGAFARATTGAQAGGGVWSKENKDGSGHATQLERQISDRSLRSKSPASSTGGRDTPPRGAFIFKTPSEDKLSAFEHYNMIPGGKELAELDIPDVLKKFSLLYKTRPNGSRHRTSEVLLDVSLIVKMQFRDLRTFLIDYAAKYGFKIIRRPNNAYPCLAYKAKSIDDEGGAPLGAALCVILLQHSHAPHAQPFPSETNVIRRVSSMEERASPSSSRLEGYFAASDSEKKHRHAATTMNLVATPASHVHRLPMHLVMLAHTTQSVLPDDAEMLVVQEVQGKMEKLAIFASRVWLWTKIVNPAETTLASEISQLLSMVKPLPMSTVDARLEQLWHLDIPAQSLLEHLNNTRQGSAKLSACRQWLVLVGPGDNGLHNALIMVWSLSNLIMNDFSLGPEDRRDRSPSIVYPDDLRKGPVLCRCNEDLTPDDITARESVWISSVVTDVCFWLWTLLL